MATNTIALTPTLPSKHYLNATYGIRSWLLTTDHKRIALLYVTSVAFFFMLGGIFAFIIRLHLLTPQGTLVSPDTYNSLFTGVETGGAPSLAPAHGDD
jgi:cytochrome c oxidase subunit 1